MDTVCLAVGPFSANTYLVRGSGGAALVVDPGGEPERILEALEERRLGVAGYVLTHGHADHVAALAALRAERPAPAAMHPQDLRWAFTRANCIPPHYDVPHGDAADMEALADGEMRRVAGLACRVLATPGHSPGGVCLHFEEQEALFTGDTLFQGSVGRTDLPGGDADALTRSLRRLAGLPGGTRVYPGHGPPTTIAAEKRRNPYLRTALRSG